MTLAGEHFTGDLENHTNTWGQEISMPDDYIWNSTSHTTLNNFDVTLLETWKIEVEQNQKIQIDFKGETARKAKPTSTISAKAHREITD